MTRLLKIGISSNVVTRKSSKHYVRGPKGLNKDSMGSMIEHSVIQNGNYLM